MLRRIDKRDSYTLATRYFQEILRSDVRTRGEYALNRALRAGQSLAK